MTTIDAPPTSARLSAGVCRTLLAVYAVVTVVNVASTAADSKLLHDITTALLVPVLLVWLLGSTVRPVPRPTRILAIGLLFAWGGDLALLGSDEVRFISGIALFLVMQICYIAAFRGVPGPGLVRAWPVAAIPYALVWLALTIAMLRHSGAFAIPGVFYGIVLVLMALSALDLVIRVRPQSLGWRVAIGAALFMLSDALIALSAFAGVPASPLLSTAVMATYAVAQAMIVTGLVRAANTMSAG